MKRLILWFSLSLMALISLSGCGSTEKKATAGVDNSGAAVIPVETFKVGPTNLSVMKTYTGTLEGEAQANIVAKISERITGINTEVGKSVAKGSPVILLDKSGTTSQYYQAEANYTNAGKNLERMRTLLAEGAISQQLFDGTQTAYDVAKANFDAARSAVILTSPISGVITALTVSLGDLAVPGAVLATVANIQRMKVIFNVSEADVMRMSTGQRVKVHSEGAVSAEAKGQVVQIAKSADVRSRSFEIRALFPNTADQWYRPGMFCKVAVEIAPRQNVLAVPASSILSDGFSTSVFKVAGNRAIRQAVVTGISDGEKVEIVSGLQNGDIIVTVGATNLRDSSLVKTSPMAN